MQDARRADSDGWQLDFQLLQATHVIISVAHLPSRCAPAGWSASCLEMLTREHFTRAPYLAEVGSTSATWLVAHQTADDASDAS